MIFLSLIVLIMCKALINDKLSEDFYLRISAIILLFSAILSYNCLFISVLGEDGYIAAALTTTLNYNIDLNSGIGIYSGLFHITNISQLLEIFLFIISSIILIS